MSQFAKGKKEGPECTFLAYEDNIELDIMILFFGEYNILFNIFYNNISVERNIFISLAEPYFQ